MNESMDERKVLSIQKGTKIRCRSFDKRRRSHVSYIGVCYSDTFLSAPTSHNIRNIKLVQDD